VSGIALALLGIVEVGKAVSLRFHRQRGRRLEAVEQRV
jgi:hypothetical protein